eukprot:m.227051 g.227051  ORF g.227051 m.227051 type:complete len:174 (-) comp26408_c0_seq3:1081-1602(-)
MIMSIVAVTVKFSRAHFFPPTFPFSSVLLLALLVFFRSHHVQLFAPVRNAAHQSMPNGARGLILRPAVQHVVRAFSDKNAVAQELLVEVHRHVREKAKGNFPATLVAVLCQLHGVRGWARDLVHALVEVVSKPKLGLAVGVLVEVFLYVLVIANNKCLVSPIAALFRLRGVRG